MFIIKVVCIAKTKKTVAKQQLLWLYQQKFFVYFLLSQKVALATKVGYFATAQRLKSQDF